MEFLIEEDILYSPCRMVWREGFIGNRFIAEQEGSYNIEDGDVIGCTVWCLCMGNLGRWEKSYRKYVNAGASKKFMPEE